MITLNPTFSPLASSTLVQVATAKEQKQFQGKPFPYIISPASTNTINQVNDSNDNCNSTANDSSASKEELLDFVKQNRSLLLNYMIEYGAVCLRGFPLSTPRDFQDVLDCLEIEELPYVGGAAPRNVVYKNVVTTNEAPPDAKIPFHHEMAQVPLYPGKIFFFCEIPSPEGGQTPICLSNQVYERLKLRRPEFISKLEEKGVIYTRVLPCEDDPSSPIGRGWKSTFQTSDKTEAEQKAKDLGVKLEWLPNGDVKSVSGILKGVKPYKGKNQFFNSIVAAYTGWKDSRNDPTTAVVFGDGEKLDPVAIQDAFDIMNEVCSDWKWQQGDLLMIDNEQTMHARRSFVPPRRILASIYK